MMWNDECKQTMQCSRMAEGEGNQRDILLLGRHLIRLLFML
jgi:hypothetical protein